MPARPPLLRALLHVVLAWGLGVCAGLLGTRALVASLFGGPVALLLTCGVPTAVVAALAVVLDRAAGPGAAGRSGAVVRGTAVGVLGTATVLVLAWAAIRADVDSVLPVGLRYAAAGLPFAAVAGLEWPGAVRVLTALAVVGSVAVVAVPRAAEAQRQAQADAVGTEVGTTARPWVTEVDGFRGRSPQHTGTDLLWTPYLPADGASAPVLWLSRQGDAWVPADPCTATAVWTPEGDQPTTACTRVDGDRWLRTTDLWQELLTRRDGVWVGVTAPRDIPRALLDQALAGARPMTGDEYETWLDEVLP